MSAGRSCADLLPLMARSRFSGACGFVEAISAVSIGCATVATSGLRSSTGWLAFLQSRRGLLDGVVFSGGEPTLQAALPAALAEVRAMGFATGLHTGGMYPERLAAVLPLVDWVGLDVKGPLHAYDGITGVPGSGKRAWESLQLVVPSGVPYECRTTWNPALFDLDALKDLGETLVDSGVTHWALQQCRAPGLAASEGLPPVVETLGERFASFSVRRG